MARYPKEQKAQTREQIVVAAAQAFREEASRAQPIAVETSLRAGQAATGYALRAFPRASNISHQQRKGGNSYSYAQPAAAMPAPSPGSKFNRQGGSILNRRGHK